MRNWICPTCGSTARAPGRPRRNDVRRFCLACSKRTGFLVERTCPTLEAKRAKGKAHSTTKAKRKALKAAVPFTVDDLDLRTELRRLCRLGYWEGKFTDGNVPTLAIRRSRNPHKYWVSGHAKCWSNRILITLPLNCDRAKASQVLLHELTHIAVDGREGTTPDGRRDIHGGVFTGALFEAGNAAYNIDLVPDWMLSAYHRDRQQEDATRAAWAPTKEQS